MKTQKILKITALSCVAVFALGVLIFGLVTGFGIEDVRALFEKPAESGYDTPYTYTEDLDYLDELVIDWPGGPVTLSLYDGDVVTVTETARRALEEEEKLALEIDGGTLSIRWNGAWLQAGISDDEAKRLEVQVPQALAEDLSAVSIRTSSGDVSASGFAAREISLETVSGRHRRGGAARRPPDAQLHLRRDPRGESRGHGEYYGRQCFGRDGAHGRAGRNACALLDLRHGRGRRNGRNADLPLRFRRRVADAAELAGPRPRSPRSAAALRCAGRPTKAALRARFPRCPAKRTAALTRRRTAAPTPLGAGEAALRISTTSGNVELAPLA